MDHSLFINPPPLPNRDERVGLAIATKRDDATVSVYLSGEFTYIENGQFKQLIEQLGNETFDRLIIDFSSLHYMDSAALGMLLLLRDALSEHDLFIVLHDAKGQVLKMFQLSHFDTLFEVVLDD